MEEQKRIYRYYDKINGKYVRLEVTDEVAKFLQNNTKQWQRQQEDCYDYNVSLNKVLYEDDDDNPITLEDVVPDGTDDEIREFQTRSIYQHLHSSRPLEKSTFDHLWKRRFIY